jgi:phage terminase Nu1 subunit (DNA packaging protein)
MARAAKKTSPVGKAELAAAIGWTRPRLDRRLDQDPNFPVKKRGTRAGGWEFDLPAVLAYLAGAEAPAPAKAAKKSKAEPKKAAPDAQVLPYEGVPDAPGISHRGESTASQRLKNAQAARVEDGLRKDRRELVEAEEMRIVLGTMLARLGKGLDSLPDMVTKRLGLQEEASDVIRTMVDELRGAMVADLRTLLAKPQ